MPKDTSHMEEQLLQLFRIFPYGIMFLDTRLRIIFANHAAASLLDQKPESLAGRPVSDVLPAEWFRGFDPTASRTMDTLIAARTVSILFWPATSKAKSPNEGDLLEKLSGVLFLTNISQTVGLQQENQLLREAARDLDAIFASSFDEIFVTDGEGKTLRVNPACERLYGIPAPALVGRNVRELEKDGIFSPSATPLVLESRERVTVVQDTKSGRKVVATANPVFDDTGKLIRVVTNSRDITELHNLANRQDETESLVNRYLSEVQALRQDTSRVDNVVVQSQALRRVVQMVRKIAPFDSTILLQGECGTGKDTVAKMVHNFSPRSSGPFIKVNCGAIPEALMESELFGYVPGAFTGAHRSGKIGVVELANKGTLFLNEIDALPLQLQVKMLHVIQERQFMRVGGLKVIEIDVRIIAACNKELYRLVEQGRFREDLFYRLNVIQVLIPPLRERKEDIAPLAAHFLRRVCARYAIEKGIAAPAMDLLATYPWPGNVRELENAIERAAVISNNPTIHPEDLPENIRASISARFEVLSEQADANMQSLPLAPINYAETRDAVEREMLLKALETCRTTRKAAQALGISQSTIVRKMKRYGIKPMQN